MSRMAGLLCALLTASVALAGCADDAPTPAAVALPSTEVVTLEPGSIRGAVVTDTQVTVQGARVVARVPASGSVVAEAETDEGGLFELMAIPEGAYEVAATAPGYQESYELVPVFRGAVTEPVFVMLSTAPGEYAGFVVNSTRVNFGGIAFKLNHPCQETGVHPMARTCAVRPSGCTSPAEDMGGCTFSAEPFVNEGWATIVGETQWRRNEEMPIGTVFLPRRGVSVYYELNAPGAAMGEVGEHLDDPRRWWDSTDQAPIVHRVERTDLAERGIDDADACCDWTWRVAAGWCDLGRCQEGGPDAGVSLDHIVTVYVAVFFGDPAPEEFTMVDLTKQLECKPPRCGGI